VKAKVPPEVPLLIEVGSPRPTETSFDSQGPFEILWVLTNGVVQRCFLRITIRKTGIYVSHGGDLGDFHTSRHADGRTWWRFRPKEGKKLTHGLGKRKPIAELAEPELIENATISIDDDTMTLFAVTEFQERHRPDSIIFLDTRVLSGALAYQVWAVPPFAHGKVPLMTDWRAQLHLVTHTVPWLMVVIYEQGERPKVVANGRDL
jgi:hypothetical protein